MCDVLRVKWTIVLQKAPRPLLHCKRCGGISPFRASDKIRVNANGKQIDAWLIYKCTSCDGTWNRPILERRHVRSIEPLFLRALRSNEPALAHRLAFDIEGLRRRAPRLEEFAEVAILKEGLSESSAPPRRLDILCVAPHPVALRIDRMLASELLLSRSQIQRLAKSGALVAVSGASLPLDGSIPRRNAIEHDPKKWTPFFGQDAQNKDLERGDGPQINHPTLGRPVRDGMRLLIDLGAQDAGRMAAAASGRHLPPQ